MFLLISIMTETLCIFLVRQ